MQGRLQKCRYLLQKISAQAVIVTKGKNRQYLSGFTGSSGVLLITNTEQVLFTDFRYVEQAKAQAPDFTVVRHGTDLFSDIALWLQEHHLEVVAYEADQLTVDTYEKLQKALQGQTLLAAKLDELRQIKDDEELAYIDKAVEIADQAFNQLLTLLRPGMTELEAAAQLEYAMRKLGSEKTSFDTIVASGERGALPHGQASLKMLSSGELITFDFGAVYKGYCSDMTRTVSLGKASEKQRIIYDTVLKAQLAALQEIKAGRVCSEIDKVARDVIAAAGYGDYFGHGLGHSVGLAIHEEPRLSPTCQDILAEHMTMTVEPGIYVPGFGGVRIEDLVVVSASGCRILTQSTKELIELKCN